MSEKDAVETETVETEPVEETAEVAPKVTETVDFWKARARENEKRAKDNAAKAMELDELKAANLTEKERDVRERDDAKREAAEARAEALRWRVAARHGLSDEDTELFLTGTDEETLTRQAERLVARTPVPGKGTHVPGVGNQPAKPPTLQEQIRVAEADGDREMAMRLKTDQIAAMARQMKM